MSRPSFYAVILSACLLALIPTSVLAQGCYLPVGGPGCYWLPGGASLSTGYFGHRTGADICFSASNQPTGSVKELRQQFDLQGVALDLVVPVAGWAPLGVTVGGGYSFCLNEPSQETIQLEGSGSMTREWRAEPQAGNLYAALTMAFHPALTGMVGIKYDNFQANFVSPSSGFGAALGTLDTAAVSINTVTPYLGLVYGGIPNSFGLNVQLGIVGFPVVLGWADYRETVAATLNVGGATVPGFPASNNIGSGYFMDAFADVSLTTVGCIQLGAYVKYNTMNAESEINVGERNAYIPDVTYKLEFQKRSWGVGGRMSVLF